MLDKKHNNFAGINDVNNYQGRYDFDNYMFRRSLNNVFVNNTDKTLFRRGLNSFEYYDESKPIIECNTRRMGCRVYNLPNANEKMDLSCNQDLLDTSNATGNNEKLVPATVSFVGVPQGCLVQNNVYSCTDSAYPKFTRNAKDVYSNQTGATNFLNQAIEIIKNLITPKQTDIKLGNVPDNVSEDKLPEQKEVKILGMSPITFALVSIGVVAIGGIVTYKLIKK